MKKNIDDIKYSKNIYCLKAISLISIVLAHTPLSYLPSSYFKNFLVSFSSFGTVMFFIISGYFFNKNKDILSIFWKKKMVSIVIPWIISGTLVYSKRLFHGSAFNIAEMISFIYGAKSFMYFLTMLLFSYVVLWKLKKKNSKVLMIVVLITLFSRLLTTLNIFPEEIYSGKFLVFNYYLNIFNWIGFVAFGMICENENLLDKCYENSKMMIFAVVSFVLLIICCVSINDYLDLFPIREALWIIIIIYVSLYIKNGILNSFEKIGKASFSIYLYHQFLTTKILVNDNQLVNPLCALIRPIIIIFILFAIFFIGDILTRKISLKLNKLYKTMLGLRI